MATSAEQRLTARLLEFGRTVGERRSREDIADEVVAIVSELGAGQVVMAMPGGPEGELRVVATRGLRQVPTGTPLSILLPLAESDALRVTGEEQPTWTVVPIGMPAAPDGSLLARIPSGGALTEDILRGIGEVAGSMIDGQEQLGRDALTGLLSRRGFDEGLTRAMRAEQSSRWTVVSCNLNNFRWINELLGYQRGDALLRTVAARLVEEAPRGAFLARVGADHFLVAVQHEAATPSAAGFIVRLDDALRKPVDLGGEVICPSATFGSAGGRGGVVDAVEAAGALVTLADGDLRRNRDRRDGRPYEAGSIDSLRLDADMHAAVASQSIVAHFQPLYHLRTGDLTGFEALARWTTAAGRTVSPAEFIPLAEENGLIHVLGDQMLRQAEQLLARYADEPHLTVHVNVSTVQLTTPGYAAMFAQQLAGNEALRRITVEVTESRQIVDHAAVASELTVLREMGVQVALDDFGSGYSTFARLQQLPATQIKIDKDFVQQAISAGTGILESMISVARAFGLEVVAEGVETKEQLEMVQRLGFDRVQGYLFSRAVTPDALPGSPRTISGMLSVA